MALTGLGRMVPDVTEPMEHKIVELTAAQILALNATPIELLAAPGANRAIEICAVLAFLDFNSAAYAGIAAAEDLEIRYKDTTDAVNQWLEIETTGYLDQALASTAINLAAGYDEGDTALQVDAITGFLAGDEVVIGSGATQERATILSVAGTTMTLTAGLQNDQANNATIVGVAIRNPYRYRNGETSDKIVQANRAVVARLSGAITTGDSPVWLKVYYRILRLPR